MGSAADSAGGALAGGPLDDGSRLDPDTAARDRLGAWRKLLRNRLRNQPTYKGLTPRLGVSDTRLGTAGVARRAERDLAG